MADEPPDFRLAELVATQARGLGIETALIGATALAAHNYVRGTLDIDLGSQVDPAALQTLARALVGLGLKTRLTLPDDEDDLGGVLTIWERATADGDPVDPVEIVNFLNPHRPRPNPGADAIKNALQVDADSSLRYVQLADLVALKLFAGGRRDQADVVDVLRMNPDADLESIRATCERYGLRDALEPLLAEAQA